MKTTPLWMFLAFLALALCGHLWLQNDTLRQQNAALHQHISDEQADDQQFSERLNRWIDDMLRQLDHMKAALDVDQVAGRAPEEP